MPKKTAKQLDDEIDRYLRGELKGPRVLAPPPKFNAKKGAWYGGDRRTLYTFTIDGPMAGQKVVRPGGGDSKSPTLNAGPGSSVRIATLAEAEKLWQSPLHEGWNVKG